MPVDGRQPEQAFESSGRRPRDPDQKKLRQSKTADNGISNRTGPGKLFAVPPESGGSFEKGRRILRGERKASGVLAVFYKAGSGVNNMWIDEYIVCQTGCFFWPVHFVLQST